MSNIKNFSIGEIPLPNHEQISLGKRHPTSTGAISIAVELDGSDRIACADVTSGFGHRGAEKLFEVRDYRAMIMLADRHDWLAAFSGELSLTLTVENAMRLTSTPRSTMLRTLLAELSRIHSHLAFLSYIADEATAARLWAVVESIRMAMLDWAGNRVHPMLNRVGGLASDVPEGWIDRLEQTLDDAARVAAELRACLAATPGSGGSPSSTARPAWAMAFRVRSPAPRGSTSTGVPPDTWPTGRSSGRYSLGRREMPSRGSPS